MKKIRALSFAFTFLTLLGGNIHAQMPPAPIPIEDENQSAPYKPSIDLFTLDASEEGSVLISLSDVYPLSDDPHLTAIPGMTENGFELAQYTLKSIYRERFLSQTGLLETDTVFIYDYQYGNLTSFAVQDLNVIARLSPYSDPANGPFSQYDYQIGFEINPKALAKIQASLWNTLVYVGQKSPFTQKPLTPLVWHEITPQKYPATSETQDATAFLNATAYINSPRGKTYASETNDFQYFLQDYMGNTQTQIMARRLLVVESQTQKTVIDKLFYESESTSLATLNYQEGDDAVFQWTGKLFQNKPPVIFGFEWHSFGCPYISVIASSHEKISIHCDNRH